MGESAKFNLLDKMEKAKAEGKIHHIGFSFHDKLDVFKKIVDGYDGWEFCQIQLNYIDTEYQAGIEGMKYAAERGLGIAIMEPLLGGRLAEPPKDIKEALGGMNPIEAALGFLWDMPEVGVVLSGMSDMEQLAQNIRLADASAVGKFSEEQKDIMQNAKRFTIPRRSCPARAAPTACPAQRGSISRVLSPNTTTLPSMNLRMQKILSRDGCSGRCLHRLPCLRDGVSAAFKAQRAHA